MIAQGTAQMRAQFWPQHLALGRGQQLCVVTGWAGLGDVGFGGGVGKSIPPLQEAVPTDSLLFRSLSVHHWYFCLIFHAVFSHFS